MKRALLFLALLAPLLAPALWTKAQHAFGDLLNGTVDDRTKHLIHFKETICLLEQGKASPASAMIKSFSHLHAEPVYHLSRAAEAFHEGDKPAAQSRIASAKRICPPEAVSVYLDSFIELGWVQPLAL